MDNTIILGNGFVTRSLKQYFPQSIITGNQINDSVFFEFLDENTWQNLPKTSSLCIITFKLTNLKTTQKLYEQILNKYEKIIVLSSTGTYLVNVPNQEINETQPRDKNQIRVLCENYLLNKGAMVVCLSLIYGKQRSLKKWLKNGNIKNGNKLINLIHIDDLSFCLYSLKEKFEKGLINISNGKKNQWQSIANLYNIQLPKNRVGKESKFISNKKLLQKLSYNFKNYT